MQILQPTQSEVCANAVPTHKLSGSEQLNPFGRSLRGAVATKTHEPKQTRNKSWTKPRGCLRLLLCSFLGLEPKIIRQLNCKFVQTFKIQRSSFKKTFFHHSKTCNTDTAVAFAPLRRPAPIKSSHLMTGAWSVVIIEGHRQPPSRC